MNAPSYVLSLVYFGGMLLGAIAHVGQAGGDPRTFFGKIYGQEKNLTTSSIARMNLVLHGVEDFTIAREDTLRSPAFVDSATSLPATVTRTLPST